MSGTHNWYDTPSITVDFDGTLCHDDHAEQPGPPIAAVVEEIRRLAAAGWHVVVCSSRPPNQIHIVRDWLDTHKIPSGQIILGGKPCTDSYLDDRGFLPPPSAIAEWAHLRRWNHTTYQEWAAGTDDTPFRADMHNCGERAGYLGDDPNGCHVVIPVTGGLDSATCYAMARAMDLPVLPVYVDYGADYVLDEIHAAHRIAPDLTILPALHSPLEERWGHVVPGRNAILAWTIADWFTDTHPGGYGELWLGVHGEEMKLRAGDKAIRFHTTMQHLFTGAGLDLRINLPLAGMSKADLVRWWAARGRIDEALATRTCFTAGPGHCGHCWACLQRVLAFGAAGFLPEVLATMPGYDFAGPARALWAKHRDRTHTGQRSGRDPATFAILDQLNLTDME